MADIIISILVAIILTYMSHFLLQKDNKISNTDIFNKIKDFKEFMLSKKIWHLSIFSCSFWLYGVYLLQLLDIINFHKEGFDFIYLTISIIFFINIYLMYVMRKKIVFVIPMYLGYPAILGLLTYKTIPIKMILLSSQGIFLTLFCSLLVFYKNETSKKHL